MTPESSESFVTPSVVSSHFHLRDGDMVGDFGAGAGNFLRTLSLRVGNSGKIYACEIQKQLVEAIGAFAHKENLSNIYPLWCDLEEPQGIPLQPESLDVGILANTLFQIEDKEAAVKEIARVLRRGGRLILIDWTESYAGLGPSKDHVIEKKEATALLESHGYVLEQEFPAGSHHYGLSFRKV